MALNLVTVMSLSIIIDLLSFRKLASSCHNHPWTVAGIFHSGGRRLTYTSNVLFSTFLQSLLGLSYVMRLSLRMTSEIRLTEMQMTLMSLVPMKRMMKRMA